jgi:lipid A 3-O-deacylase
MAILHRIFAALLALQTLVPSHSAKANPIEPDPERRSTPFFKGMHEFELGGAYHFSLANRSEKHPELNDASIQLRYGWMLSSAPESGLLAGNWEAIAGFAGGAITQGPGSFLFDAVALLRRNFATTTSTFVPYFQLGAGGTYSDASRQRVQRLIGSDLSFNLQSAIGLKLLTSSRSALFIEGGYRHVSNANTASRNFGLNSIGIQLGFSRFF